MIDFYLGCFFRIKTLSDVREKVLVSIQINLRIKTLSDVREKVLVSIQINLRIKTLSDVREKVLKYSLLFKTLNTRLVEISCGSSPAQIADI